MIHFQRNDVGGPSERPFKEVREADAPLVGRTVGPTLNVVCFAGVSRLERIEIENFKAIRKLVLDVPPRGDRESWLMFVGENATGKSSLLQAVCLALLGPSHIAELELDARDFVSHGEGEGVIRIFLPDVREPVTLAFTRRSPHFICAGGESGIAGAVFSSARPRSGISASALELADRTKVSDRRFGEIALVLKQLLLLTGDDAVVRDRRGVKVKFGGHSCPLPELSGGYQAVVALALGIIMSLGDGEGIVLVDEIETHLHPAWKLEIVIRLRRVFPRLHFLASTHDPLCLRGLLPGEVVVLRRSGDDVSAELITHSVDHLRADQLLTSPLFGLLTTRAPEFQRKTDRYSQLLGQSQRTREEEQDLLHLRAVLSTGIQSSESPSEHYLERAIRVAIRHLAQQPIMPVMSGGPSIADERVRNDIRRKLTEILA